MPLPPRPGSGGGGAGGGGEKVPQPPSRPGSGAGAAPRKSSGASPVGQCTLTLSNPS